MRTTSDSKRKCALKRLSFLGTSGFNRPAHKWNTSVLINWDSGRRPSWACFWRKASLVLSRSQFGRTDTFMIQPASYNKSNTLLPLLPFPPLFFIFLYNAYWQFALFCCFLGGVCPSPPYPTLPPSTTKLVILFGTETRHSYRTRIDFNLTFPPPTFFLCIVLIGNLRCISSPTSTLGCFPTFRLGRLEKLGRWEKFNLATIWVDSCYRNIWHLSSSSRFRHCNKNHFALYPEQCFSKGPKFMLPSFLLIFDLLFTKIQMYYITMDYKIRYWKILLWFSLYVQL